jgi:MraZ protein
MKGTELPRIFPSAIDRMSATENTEIYYSSFFRHGVDEKRRLQIPAKWRPADPEFFYTLILWPKGSEQDACLLALPPAVWRALVDKLKQMPFADPKAQALRRLIGMKSAQVTLDKAGRVCLPEEMAKTVGIEKEAVLVGMLDRFQIWSPERHVAVKAEDETLAPDVFQLLS